MAIDVVSLAVALVALASVFVLWWFGFHDQTIRTRQLRILARHAKALEEMVKSQGKVLTALGEGQKSIAPDWYAEAERRRQAAESDPALKVWDDLEDLVGRK